MLRSASAVGPPLSDVVRCLKLLHRVVEPPVEPEHLQQLDEVERLRAKEGVAVVLEVRAGVVVRNRYPHLNKLLEPR